MLAKKNIWILSQYFPPEMGAPQNRLYELSQELSSIGHKVSVITAMPNYPTGIIFSKYRNKFYIADKYESVDVHRCAIFPSKSKKIIPRLISYLSFQMFSLPVAMAKIKSGDVLIVESPPLFLLLSGLMLKFFKKVYFVANISDLWPDSFVDMQVIGRETMAYSFLKKIELLCYNNADLITGQSKGIIDKINELTRVKTLMVTNGVTEERFNIKRDLAQERFNWGGRTVLGYLGLHGLAQGLQHLLKIAEKFKNDETILFVFFGDGPTKDDLMNLASESKLNNVKFFDPVDRETYPYLLRSINVSLVPLSDQIHGAIPSKIYEAMISECPIILFASGEPAEIINKSKCGIVIDKNLSLDVQEMKIRELIGNQQLMLEMGLRGREVAINNYTRRSAAAKLSDKIHELF